MLTPGTICRTYVKLLSLVLIMLISEPAAFGQQIIQIDDNIHERNLMPYEISYYVDTTNTLSFDDISARDFRYKFRIHSNYQNADFKSGASYWIKLPIQHTVNSKQAWLLEFYDQTIDHIEAYIPQEDGTYRKIMLGDSQPFEKRLFRHKNFEINLDMKSFGVKDYYFRVKSKTFADIRIGVRSVNRFIYYALNEYFLFGTFYGMIVIIALYNLLVFLAIREIKNIYYILYILSVAAYAMSYDGIGFQYLWPSYPQLNDYATGFWLYSVIFWGLVFTRRFLNTRRQAPGIDRALMGMIIARSALFFIEFFFFPEMLTYRTLEIIPLSLIFYAGIAVWRRGYRPARFFVISYGILFAGFFIRTLVYLNILPFTTSLHYSLHFSFVIEMLFLTFALGDRIRILKDMRDRAMKRTMKQHEINLKLKDKVNKELEEKVRERTVELNQKNAELEESNKKLAIQAEQINRMNSMLDLDNWKLKNNIKEVLNERLLEKAMDYKQFQTIYPDQLACYRFLEELKWSKGFSCRKCSNTKYFDGAQKFARRCTKCGYNESITAYTIFHSIKFPIEKAFYLAYLTVTGKDEYTLEALANQLGVGLNTIWAFKHKVAERVSELESTGKKPRSSWEIVILLPHKVSRKATKSSKIPEI